MSGKTTADIRRRIHRRIRKRLSGSKACPRLAVCRSQKHIYAQVIDDDAGQTLCAAGSLDPEIRQQSKRGSNVDAAKEVGALVARRASENGITTVVFDRGGFKYHGRVKALAEAARESGLKL
jgi:large subunit ribosomal protein L18